MKQSKDVVLTLRDKADRYLLEKIEQVDLSDMGVSVYLIKDRIENEKTFSPQELTAISDRGVKANQTLIRMEDDNTHLTYTAIDWNDHNSPLAYFESALKKRTDHIRETLLAMGAKYIATVYKGTREDKQEDGFRTEACLNVKVPPTNVKGKGSGENNSAKHYSTSLSFSDEQVNETAQYDDARVRQLIRAYNLASDPICRDLWEPVKQHQHPQKIVVIRLSETSNEENKFKLACSVAVQCKLVKVDSSADFQSFSSFAQKKNEEVWLAVNFETTARPVLSGPD